MHPVLPKTTLISCAAIVVLASVASLPGSAVEDVTSRPAAATAAADPTTPVTTSAAAPGNASNPIAPVLSPDKYFGPARAGYAAAQKVPDICAKLFCYCGCDLSDNHSSLLDCFTTDHGADCSICQDEAVLALKMKKEGKSLADIQKAVDRRFLKEYQQVFSVPSEALLKYRQQREWHPSTPEDAPQPSASAAGGSAKPGNVDKPAGAANLVVPKKPGCCGGK
jgi:Protein of unknown function with PCYCGC motif